MRHHVGVYAFPYWCPHVYGRVFSPCSSRCLLKVLIDSHVRVPWRPVSTVRCFLQVMFFLFTCVDKLMTARSFIDGIQSPVLLCVFGVYRPMIGNGIDIARA